jgi:uncharacterized protein YndB with AHSA1/START domain
VAVASVAATVQAPPAAVFAVLADGWLSSNWVVDTSHMRAVEADWPAVGSRLHPATGVWPLVTRDESIVEEVEDGRRLVLTAKGGRLGEARVVVELEPAGTGTRVTMAETPITGPGKWVHRVSEAILLRRNAETLARLAALAERRTQPAD